MPTKREVEKAANAFEQLLILGKQMLDEMRDDAKTPATRYTPYDRIYWFRRELNKNVLRPLGGEGCPTQLKTLDSHYYSE